VKVHANTIIAPAAVLLAACASAKRNPVLDKYPPGVSGLTSVFYYDVHGSTVAELHADMRKLGPKIDGASFVGEARSPMRWTWRTERASGGCEIREVTVYVNAQITLPRWTPPPTADSSVVAEWNRFLTALEVHEAGHKDITAKSGKAIIDRLRGLSGPCALLSTRANDLARDIVTRASEEQRLYDATTRHGLTQGTAFGLGRSVSATDALTMIARPRPGTVRGVLRVPLARAWAMLPAAFSDIELTVNAVDSVAHTMGDSTILHGKLGQLAADDVVSCGTPPTGRHADSVAVAVFITARLEESDSLGSVVTNTVQAVARPAGAPPILCGSRGVIERRLLEALRSRVGGT
jgi:predicted secreted Zn-dependent protease